MRPTDLHFRSVREKTPEPKEKDSPVITRNGEKLFSYIERKGSTPTPGKVRQNSNDQPSTLQYPISGVAFGAGSKRFTAYDECPRREQMIGPGVYDPDFSKITKFPAKPCSIVYKHLSMGKEETRTGHWHYEGSRLIKEPNFTDPRKQIFYSVYHNTSLPVEKKQLSTSQGRKRERKASKGSSHISQPQQPPIVQQRLIFQGRELPYNTVQLQKRLSRNKPKPQTTTFQRRASSKQRNFPIAQQSENLMIFMGETLNLKSGVSTMVTTQTATGAVSIKGYKEKIRPKSGVKYNSIYRVLANDSNKASAYFQKSFMCPTESSTYQRAKPVAYDLEQTIYAKEKPKRAHSALGVKALNQIKRFKNSQRNRSPFNKLNDQVEDVDVINILVNERPQEGTAKVPSLGSSGLAPNRPISAIPRAKGTPSQVRYEYQMEEEYKDGMLLKPSQQESESKKSSEAKFENEVRKSLKSDQGKQKQPKKVKKFQSEANHRSEKDQLSKAGAFCPVFSQCQLDADDEQSKKVTLSLEQKKIVVKGCGGELNRGNRKENMTMVAVSGGKELLEVGEQLEQRHRSEQITQILD